MSSISSTASFDNIYYVILIIVIIHIIYFAVIGVIYITQKHLLKVINYYILVVFQLLIAAYIIIKFNGITSPKPLNKWEYAIISISGWFLLFITLSTGLIGTFMQGIVNKYFPIHFDVLVYNV